MNTRKWIISKYLFLFNWYNKNVKRFYYTVLLLEIHKYTYEFELSELLKYRKIYLSFHAKKYAIELKSK